MLAEQKLKEIDRQMTLAEDKILEAQQERDAIYFDNLFSLTVEETCKTVVFLGELALPEVEQKLRELGCETETHLVFGEPRTWIRF